jgi:excisionase family DNA binding protein
MDDTKKPTELLTVAQTAERLSLSLRSVWTLIARRKLTPIRLGRRATRIDAAEVAQFVEDARARALREGE